MRELGLFAGVGGGLLASRLLGWRTVCAVEIEPYCQRVLAQRQRDGALEPFPIWDDIRTFDGGPWRGHVDVVSGGFPCQDISSAGKRAGLDGDRSGLWFEMLRVIGEVRPAFVFAENSPNLRTSGLQVVLKGLAELGYDAAWGVLGAWHVGAPHRRNRMWIVAAHPDRCREREQSEHAEVAGTSGAGRNAAHASGARLEIPEPVRTPAQIARVELCDQRYVTHTDSERSERRSPAGRGELGTGRRPAADSGHVANANGHPLWEQPGRSGGQNGPQAREPRDADWWGVHRFAGVDDGLASRLDRVRATGNGQVPAVAALAWRVLSETLTKESA